MTAHSHTTLPVVSIRYVAMGFMGQSTIILVIAQGAAHLVACPLDPDRFDPDYDIPTTVHSADVDRRFGILVPTIIGDEGFCELAEHIRELRMVDKIQEPIRWCCRENLMQDFSMLPHLIPDAAVRFQPGTLADLSTGVKTKVLEFACERLRPRTFGIGTTKSVRARYKRVKIPIAA